MESSQTKNYTIFIGNPGVGKSALLNCILGEGKFESGLSVGTGLTSVCQIAFNERDQTHYGDTPGLYDIKKLEEAAEEISKALKSGDGNYRIVFVLKLDGLRLRPQDSLMMKLVLDSIKIKNIQYGIILNQLNRQEYKKLINDAESKKELFTCLNEGHTATNNIYLFQLNDDILDNIFSTDITNDLHQWLQKLNSNFIKPAQVKQIDIRDFDKKIDQLQNQLIEILKNNEIREQKFQEQIKELSQQYYNKLQEQEEQFQQKYKSLEEKLEQEKNQNQQPSYQEWLLTFIVPLMKEYFAKK